MKTDFANGTRLFAEDLNTNFSETDNRLTSLEGNITITALTQSAYDGLGSYDSNVLYVIIPA